MSQQSQPSTPDTKRKTCHVTTQSLVATSGNKRKLESPVQPNPPEKKSSPSVPEILKMVAQRKPFTALGPIPVPVPAPSNVAPTPAPIQGQPPWFDLKTTHPFFEKYALAEYLKDGEGSVESYIATRNTIATEASKSLDDIGRLLPNEDASKIVQLHDSLKHWGIGSKRLSAKPKPVQPSAPPPPPKAPAEADDGWKQDQVLKLLQAVEVQPNDWSKVAMAVGKSKQDCILKFSRLPVEDPMLKSGSHFNLQAPYFPFAQVPNPLMATLGFLASNVNSSVASSAAVAALKTLLAVDKAEKPSKDQSEEETQKDKNGGEEKEKEKETVAPPREGETKDGEASKQGEEDGSKVKAEERKTVSKTTTAPLKVGAATASSSTSSPVVVPQQQQAPPAVSSPLTSPDHPKPASQVYKGDIQAAVASCLGAASAKASDLAKQEEYTMQRLLTEVLHNEMLVVQAKLQKLNKLEELMAAERVEIERQRQQLRADRLAFQASRLQQESAVGN
eukprot:NODE_1187_length_1844_cov_64.672284_g1126_i0.p1 GENE.NODE_1187_length_1844_cov_64.672284_g1126_i0~~NODE_1187_length_1844_cov_64.672284_g1126_i0.p1  ORF type:complete len:525 (+),score=139.48 NODE_1187_length_1844_cov_64.672284_g1126_i0:66-1577(+)